MRIGFVICGDLELVSGGFFYDRQIVAGLRRAGHEVSVIALPWRKRYPRAWLDNFVRLPAPELDVIIEDELCHPALWLPNRRWRRSGTAVVSLVHNLSSVQPSTRGRAIVRAGERFHFAGVDAAIAVCRATLDDVRACGGGSLPAHVALAGGDHVTPIEDDRLERRANETGPLRLVFAGTVAPHKGLHRLLPILGRLRSTFDLHLDVAGSLASDAGYVTRLRREVAARGLDRAFTFHGELGREPLMELLRQSQVFVMPSDREAYPLAALEALAAGLPTLVTAAGGAAELVGDGGACLDPDDVGAWEGAIANFARDRHHRAVVARRARARHGAHGSWAQTARGIAGFLESVVQAARLPRRQSAGETLSSRL